jgi:hypothetical protein
MTLGADATIYRFGHELNAWCHSSARVKQTSTLYDLPGRSTIGFAVLYELVPPVLRELEEAMPADRLGASMRRPLSRPYSAQLLIVLESWLMGRERRIIDAGERLPDGDDPDRDRADWSLVGSWYSRAAGSLRGDGDAFPVDGSSPEDGPVGAGETIDSQLVLGEVEMAALGADEEPLDAERASRAQRAFGALDLFALTLHGEQRDGLYDHGPSHRDDGWSVAVHEVNDLDNDILPWSSAETRLGVDAVGSVRAYRPEVDVRVDMWGTLGVHPVGPPDQVRALWARRGEELRRIELEELEELAARATAATAGLFKGMAAWEPDYRITYGAPLFLNHLIPIRRQAGITTDEELLWERADAITAAELPRLRGEGAHPIWGRLARTDTDVVYTPPRPA